MFCPAQDSSVWLGLTSREQPFHIYIYMKPKIILEQLNVNINISTIIIKIHGHTVVPNIFGT